MNMSYSELRRLPTAYRKWYLERLTKHFKDIKSNEDTEKTSISENIKTIDDMIDKLKT